MPYELRDLSPALAYARSQPEAGFALLRSLQGGLRPGFAAIVDNPEQVSAIMLVSRPDWRRGGPLITRIQLDAVASAEALRLLAWMPPSAQVCVCTYRPWLQELVQGSLEAARSVQHVICIADRQQFRPDPRAEMAVEIGPAEVGRYGLAADLQLREGDRLFGVVRDDRLLACAAMGLPEDGYVPVRYLFTQPAERRRGYGSAALSAAVQAGLEAGRAVLCRLPVSELPLLHLAARLGFAPVCREWSAEGRARP